MADKYFKQSPVTRGTHPASRFQSLSSSVSVSPQLNQAIKT